MTVNYSEDLSAAEKIISRKDYIFLLVEHRWNTIFGSPLKMKSLRH